MTAWHDRDEFWELVPLFGAEQWDAAPEEVDFVATIAGLEPGALVLDLACGGGRHSLELSRRGYVVTAVVRKGSA